MALPELGALFAIDFGLVILPYLIGLLLVAEVGLDPYLASYSIECLELHKDRPRGPLAARTR